MQQYDYLIIGGGQVSDDASRAIRELDATGTIGVLSADTDQPYSRPALSKKLWIDPDFTIEDDMMDTAQDTGAEITTGARVISIDPKASEVELAGGARVAYGRLLLATGADPVRIEAPDDERVVFFRTLEDYRTLRRLATPEARVVVLGGGYVGQELAAALAGAGVAKVTLVHSGGLLAEKRFPTDLAQRYTRMFTDHGVELVAHRRAERVEAEGDDLVAVLDDGTRLDADVVIVGIGAKPRTELAEAAGLTVEDGGVVVDEHLRTDNAAIWAAGDIASYPDALLGRTRSEHINQARASGRAAGAAMAGSEEPYTHTPFFYSMVFGHRWEAVGRTLSELDVLEVPLDDDRLVVYYLDETGRAVGVLAWGVEDAMDEARAVLADPPSDPEQLRDRIR